MKGQNNHLLSRQKEKVSILYKFEDGWIPHSLKGSDRFYYYSVSGSDLILTQERYEDSTYIANDSLRDWRLLNVNKKDCDLEKLARLMDDGRWTEIKLIERGNRKKLIIYSHTECYFFYCDDIKWEHRGYNCKELADMLFEMNEAIDEIDVNHSRMDDFLNRLFLFINGELRDCKKMVRLYEGKEDLLAIKSMHYLEILTRLKDKMDELSTIFTEDRNESEILSGMEF